MRYYKERSDVDKFLDDLFAENAEIGWQCDEPSHQNQSGVSITVVKDAESSAEETYMRSLIEEIVEKLEEIAENLPHVEGDRTQYGMSRQDVISRVISINNTADSILREMEPCKIANNLNTTAIIGGTIPTMF